MARRFVSVVPQTYEECGDSALMETRGGARGYADRLAGYYGGNPYDGTLLAKLESAYTDTGDHGSTMFVFIVEEQTVGGYEEGVVGSSHSYAVGSGEISCGMFGPLEGLFFGGYGSDRGSGPKVPVSSLGDPAGARRKPWSGYVYGAGISVDSPLGTSET